MRPIVGVVKTEAGVNFSGVLCGRATWKEGIPVYAREGAVAREQWLIVEPATTPRLYRRRIPVGNKPYHQLIARTSAKPLI